MSKRTKQDTEPADGRGPWLTMRQITALLYPLMRTLSEAGNKGSLPTVRDGGTGPRKYALADVAETLLIVGRTKHGDGADGRTADADL